MAKEIEEYHERRVELRRTLADLRELDPPVYQADIAEIAKISAKEASQVLTGSRYRPDLLDRIEKACNKYLEG